jgi:PAS domain S-box-containing protein
MKIRTKLYLNSAVSVATIVILALLLVSFSFQINEEFKKQALAHEFSTATAELVILTDKYLAYGDARTEQQIDSKLEEIHGIMEKAEGTVPLDVMDTAFKSLEESLSHLKENYQEKEELVEKNASQKEIERRIYVEERLAAVIRSNSQKILAMSLRISSDAQQEVVAIQKNATFVLLGSAVFLFLINSLSAFLISKSITKPIDELVRGTEIVGKGNLDHRIEIKSEDETGYLSQAFNEMVGRRKESEEALKKSEKQLRNVLDGLGPHMLVGLMTPDGTLIEANRPALEIAGLKPEDVLEKPFEETYWWSYSEPVKQQLRDAIRRAAKGKTSRYDVAVRVGENRFITIDFCLQPLVNEGGRINYLIPSAVDITKRKQAEEELAKHRDNLEDLVKERTAELEEKTKELERFNKLFVAGSFV